jgi:hypothetical protein
VCGPSDLQGNLTTNLAGLLESFDTDKVFAVVGSAASLLRDTSASTAGAAAATDFRDTLLQFVFQASQLQDATPSALNQQTTMINQLVGLGNLSTRALALGANLSYSITQSLADLGVTPATATAMASTLSGLMAGDFNDSVAQISTSVWYLASAGAQDLTPGEAPFTVASPSVNVSTQVQLPGGTGRVLRKAWQRDI